MNNKPKDQKMPSSKRVSNVAKTDRELSVKE